jgi:hypothetical protein
MLWIEGVVWSAQRIPTVVNLGFLDPEPLLFHSSSSSVILTRLSRPRSRANTSQKKDCANISEHTTKESKSVCWIGRQHVQDVKAGWAKPRSFLCTFCSIIIHMYIFIINILSGVRLNPLGTAATTGLLYQSQKIDDGDCGAIAGVKIGRGTEVRGENLPQCQFVHHKSRMTRTRIEPRPTRWEASD